VNTPSHCFIQTGEAVLERKFVIRIGLLFLLHPVFWILGLDQFIWLAILPLVYLHDLLHGKINAGWSRLPWFFLIVMLISSIAIALEPEPYFYLPLFAYKFLSTLSAVILFTLITTRVRSFEDIELLAMFLAIGVSISAVLGLTARLIGFDKQFTLLSYYILPGSLKSRGFFLDIFNRSLAGRTIIWGTEILRPFGLFKYANTLAGALVLTIPIQAYFATRKKRLFWVPILLISLLTLVLTTSRGGICAFCCGLLAAICIQFRRSPIAWIAGLIGIGVVALVFLGGFGTRDTISVFSRGLDQVGQVRTTVGREKIYDVSIAQIKERPLLGWGTNRKFPHQRFRVRYPYAGTHSNYLSLMYKQGLVGLGLMLFFWGKLFVSGLRLSTPLVDRGCRIMGFALIFSLVGNLAHMAILDTMDDNYLFSLSWAVWALIPCAQNACRSRTYSGSAKSAIKSINQ